jgi:NADH dehydrogenase/NADH:ubiquinone oxidoreductase subunit G
MELLLARAPESETLRALAARMGVAGTPYPTVTESQRHCILCGLCTAVCEEVIGRAAIGFAGRGVNRAVAAPFREGSADCIACGACAVVCPVGTIQVRIHADTGEAEISPFKSRAKLLTCEECGRRRVTEPVGRHVLEVLRIDREEFRRLARRCPACRRKRAAGVLAAAAAGAEQERTRVPAGAESAPPAARRRVGAGIVREP